MTKSYETKRLILRTLAADEGALSLDYYATNKDFLASYEPTRDDSFYTLKHHKKLVAIEQKEMDRLNMFRLWIFLKNGIIESPIGNIGFTNIVRGVFLSCFVGYKLDQSHLHKGYMKEALKKGIDLMFNDYGLHRIEANIMPINTPSLSLCRALGFTEEGLGKKYLKINDQWEDHVHMVKFNEAIE